VIFVSCCLNSVSKCCCWLPEDHPNLSRRGFCRFPFLILVVIFFLLLAFVIHVGPDIHMKLIYIVQSKGKHRLCSSECLQQDQPGCIRCLCNTTAFCRRILAGFYILNRMEYLSLTVCNLQGSVYQFSISVAYNYQIMYREIKQV